MALFGGTPLLSWTARYKRDETYARCNRCGLVRDEHKEIVIFGVAIWYGCREWV